MITDCIFLFGPRACGKTTVAKIFVEELSGWAVVDVDYEYRVLYKPAFRNAGPAWNPDGNYHECCRKILLDHVGRERIVIALGGGALVNDVAPSICAQNLQTCRRRGMLVLLLPSRFHRRNREILYERERQRGYGVSREEVVAQYNSRIPYLKSYADLIVYGGSPVAMARKVIRKYELG
jgi:shikimate kinase